MSVKPFKPRRILKSKAASLNPVLEAGEFIVEVPDTGVGTGPCRMKMGDGTSAYDKLPYMDKEVEAVDVAASTIAFTESETTENADLLSEIVTGKSVKNLFGSTKKLLSNLSGSVTELNNNIKNLEVSGDMTLGEMIEKIYGATYGDDPGKFTIGSYFGYNGNGSSSISGGSKSFSLLGTEGLLIISESCGSHSISVTSGSCNLELLASKDQTGYGSYGKAVYSKIYHYKDNNSAVLTHSGSYGNDGNLIGVCLSF